MGARINFVEVGGGGGGGKLKKGPSQMEKKGAKVLHIVKKGPHMVEKVPNKEKIANKPPPKGKSNIKITNSPLRE